MNNEKQIDSGRRGLLVATCAAGGVAGLATAMAFVSTFQPSERAKAAGAPLETDISSIRPGEMKVFEWRSKPVWIMKRTPEQMKGLEHTASEVADPDSLKSYNMDLPDYCKNKANNRGHVGHEETLVLVGICPHLGCSPSSKFTPGAQALLPNDWEGGFLCPCHGSTFDLAGRVFKNKPAPNNLDVPRHMYLSDNKILIGKDEKGET
ncbi:MAG: ubiquinol-cytochrome c reductase iron-sulfur subunit [Glaciimonas sp.]|nr:ubiquinol-cytochrome c reductase iron-sulfur subunit [Glaciimonas sp.]